MSSVVLCYWYNGVLRVRLPRLVAFRREKALHTRVFFPVLDGEAPIQANLEFAEMTSVADSISSDVERL